MKSEQRYHLRRLAEKIVTPTRFHAANGTCPKGNPFCPYCHFEEAKAPRPSVTSIFDGATLVFDEMDAWRGSTADELLAWLSDGYVPPAPRSESRIKRAFIRYLEELGKQASSHPFF